MRRRIVIYSTAVFASIVLFLAGAFLVPAIQERFFATPLQSFLLGGVDYYQYTPSDARPSPTTLVVLPGLGTRTDSYLRGFIPYADRYHWSLLAPDFFYDPNGIYWVDEAYHFRALHDAVAADHVAGGKVLIYGFSRGSQTGHRFALFYPDQVVAAALMSAGTYTLPEPNLDFPWGVRDIVKYGGDPFDRRKVAQIPFWIGVGELDNVASDVPREWDPYIGKTRLERARSFAAALEALGARAELTVFPGLAHNETADSRDQAMVFLHSATP